MRMHLARCSALESLDRSCAGIVGTILKSLGIRLEMSTFLDFFASCVLRNRTRRIIIVCARDLARNWIPLGDAHLMRNGTRELCGNVAEATGYRGS